MGTPRVVGAIECAIRWGMDTPCGWRGLSNVQCDEVRALRVVWWRLVGRCLCARPCRPAGAHPSLNPRAQCVYFWYGNAAARTFGRAHRHPYGFVWADCAWTVDAVWADYVWVVGGVWVDCAQTVGVLSSKNSYEVYGKKFCTH